MTAPALRIAEASKTFRTRGGACVDAVAGLDLSVDRGEIVALLGPNGAGKTTAIDMLLGLTAPTTGTVEVCGLDPRRAVREGRVSAVMQTGGLLMDFTVAETIRAIALLHHRVDRVCEVIDRAGLAPIAGRRVQACSGGEQQRLRFALALLPDPDLIVLDEPTTGMDVTARQEFWAAMRADAAEGRTILFATHYLAEADAFAERTVLMSQGRVIADAPTADIRARYGARSITFRPPADAWAGGDLDVCWLRRVEQALAPFGVTDLEVSSASLEEAFRALTEAAPPGPGDHSETRETPATADPHAAVVGAGR